MSQRAQQLCDEADRQIAELEQRLSAAGDAGLRRRCPGREKLGDGTVGAVAAHTIANYRRIASLVATAQDTEAPHNVGHDAAYRASDVDLDHLLAQLADARDALAAIGQLGDERLDTVPPAGTMKFADGARTLEDIFARLLKHQAHQVAAIAAALASHIAPA
jgi:hypothetical protein